MKELTIICKSELESISNVRGMVASLLANKNQTITFINEVKTIVSEGITNAIIHGYNEEDDNDIIIKVNSNDEGIYISIQDFGRGIEDVEQAKEVLFSTMKSKDRSGLGFTIMELFSTKFNVISTLGKGTKLEMFKEWE